MELEQLPLEKQRLAYLEELNSAIRDVPDYPKPGILFKDITPLLFSPHHCDLALDLLLEDIKEIVKDKSIDAIAGVESRGFFFGFLLANHLGIPFIPIRKEGKLPFHKVSKSYSLEYGVSTIEMHSDTVTKGMNVLLHDDLLATAGTACAAAEMITDQGGTIAGFTFLIELEFLKGREKLEKYTMNNISLLKY